MTSARCITAAPLEPVELAMLQRIFDDACENRALDRMGPDAENLAAALVELYERGIRREHQLTALIN